MPGRNPRSTLAACFLVAALLVAKLAPAAPAAATNTAIKLSPNIGPPTAPTTVAGKDFGSSEVVDITFDSALLATASTDPDGRFSTKVTIPASALPGMHTILATGETSGLTANAAFTVRTNWPHVHFDAANSGFNPYENVIDPGNVSGLVQKWAVATSPGASPTPVVSGGLVYVAPADGLVRALDPATGATVWSYDTGGTMGGNAPTVARGVLYAGNDNGVVTALQSATGRLLWTADLGDFISHSPTAANGNVYVTHGLDNSNFVDALDPSTGALVWTHGLITAGTPAVAFGLVFETDPFGCYVQGIDAVRGHGKWLFSTYCEIGSMDSAAAVDQTVFAAADGRFVALEAQTGATVWVKNSGGITHGTPAVANGVVYESTADYLFALNEGTGTIDWQTPISGGTYASPAVANGVVYLPTHDGRLRAWDASTGAPLWSSDPAPAFLQGSPAVADGVVYTADDDGTVYAFGLP
jgi:outer membrane protein assembly factor BamB